MPAGHLASLFNAQGPNINCLTACAASSQAIGEAVEIIRRGEADVMLSGGTHTMIHPFGVTGFNLLTALSTRNDEPTKASRPFDRDRDGFVLGEGAGMVMLEELEHAKARGAQIYGEIVGYGSTADAFRITDTHPEGRGAISCIKLALADAGVGIDEVDYINAHGTSTAVNDKVETLAIKQVFGPRAYKIPVSSTKSMMGHLIAAAGATELIICLLAIRDSVLPPTINYETPDPECDLDYIPNVARAGPLRRGAVEQFRLRRAEHRARLPAFQRLKTAVKPRCRRAAARVLFSVDSCTGRGRGLRFGQSLRADRPILNRNAIARSPPVALRTEGCPRHKGDSRPLMSEPTPPTVDAAETAGQTAPPRQASRFP